MFEHPHICLDASCMFGYPPYLDTPICLDAPICSDDVWMPAVHIQHKESMLCQAKGVSICPNTFVCPHMLDAHLYVWMPHMFGHPAVCLDDSYVWNPPYVWTPPICLDAPIYLDASPVCLDTPICLDALLYVWMPQCLDNPL